MRIEFSRLNDIVQQIGENIAAREELSDAVMTIHVIGEFSSGKTRFIRQLFGDLVPPALAPLSSGERETLLPLEITFGEEQRLELIRRDADNAEAEILKVYKHFPHRQELAELNDLAPDQMRLRLFINEPRLTLAQGDGFYDESGPQRLRMIDQPGWNSGDEDEGWESLGLSADWENLGLVYVCRAARLDSKLNMSNLSMFLEALRNDDMHRAREKLPVFFLITECPPEERKKWIERQQNRVDALLQDSVDIFPYKILAVDLATITADELETLRSEFWTHILSESPSPPLAFGRALAAEVRNWPQEWTPAAYLQKCLEWQERYLALAQNLKADGKYLGGRSMRFYAGLDDQAVGEKACQDWQKKLRSLGMPEQPPDLPREHPLRPWLDYYWLPRLRQANLAFDEFNHRMEQTLGQLTAKITDLEAWLCRKMDVSLERTCHPWEDSFLLLMRLLQSLPANTPQEQMLANWLASSLMECRFAETRNFWVQSA